MKLRISDEIKKSMEENVPVVALESTIISHGMPYPLNVETALEVEQKIRELGCVPATIGIIDGECVVGLSRQEIEEFGKRKDIVKVSRRDLPVIIAKKKWGATTVASTMIIANLANIKVFVTGGIGGVHRGAT
ncbi:MAG: pseudouridine-5'-phosphate glycosidase, partial [Bacilli bacterium]|nr:pseudouridine-5'-phosphate glycosidase [Bacilli bacterium]